MQTALNIGLHLGQPGSAGRAFQAHDLGLGKGTVSDVASGLPRRNDTAALSISLAISNRTVMQLAHPGGDACLEP